MTVTPIPDVTVYRKLWAAWEPLSKEEQERVNKVENGLEGLAVNDADSPTLIQRVHNLARFDIYRDIVNLYASDCDENDKDRFKKLRRELDAPAMRQFDLPLRIKRASEGKEAANEKYKDGNWFGALYTYTVAYGCLVPYYAAAVEDAKVKADYLKLNITAMIVTGMTNKKELKTVAQRKTLLEIGLRACVLVRSMADVIAAGRRATDIHKEYLATIKSTPAPTVCHPADVEWFSQQSTALKEVDGAKAYKDLPGVNKVRVPARKGQA